MHSGQSFQFGDYTFAVIHSPGHCPGQVMLLEQERGWLLAADQVLSVMAPNVWAHADAAGDQFGDFLRSLEMTKRQRVDLVLPGHGMPLRSGMPELVQSMLTDQQEYLEEVMACVGEWPITAWEVLTRVQPGV